MNIRGDRGAKGWIRQAAAMAGLAGIGLFLVLQVSPRLNQVTYDESNIVYDASRLHQGQVPYRDFFNFVPPNVFYTLYVAQRLLPGKPETASRYAVAAFMMAFTVLLYGGLRRARWTRAESLALAAVTPVCLYPFSAFALHYWLATALLMGVIVIAPSLCEGRRTASWVAMGALAGLCAGFLQTEGAYAALVAAILVASAPGSAIERLRRGVLSACGAGLGLLAGVGPLALLGAGPRLVRDVVFWPLVNYRKGGNPNDVGLLADLPDRLASLLSGWGQAAGDKVLAVVGMGLYGAVLALTAGLLVLAGLAAVRSVRPGRRAPLPLAASALTLASMAAFWCTNPTFVHLIYALAPLTGIWAFALSGERPQVRRLAVVTAAAMVMIGVGFQAVRVTRLLPAPLGLTDVDKPDRDVPFNRFLRAWDYLRPGERIAVMPTGGNIYLFSYPAAIGYTYFFPLADRYNDMEDHEVVASQIARGHPALVAVHAVSWLAFQAPEDPVGRVLRNDYRPIGETSVLVLLVPKDRWPQAVASNLQSALGLLVTAPR